MKEKTRDRWKQKSEIYYYVISTIIRIFGGTFIGSLALELLSLPVFETRLTFHQMWSIIIVAVNAGYILVAGTFLDWLALK